MKMYVMYVMYENVYNICNVMQSIMYTRTVLLQKLTYYICISKLLTVYALKENIEKIQQE